MGVMGKYPSLLADVLADNVPGEQKAVLDIGCGSAHGMSNGPMIVFPLTICRIMDVARDFPHCNSVAVDLVPLQDGYVFMISKLIALMTCLQKHAPKLQV
jgi:hypothetical protein